MIIFLDDSPERTADFLRERPRAECFTTAPDTIKALDRAWYRQEPVDELYLDHDLGGEIYADSGRADTGMEVVRWLCSNSPDVRRVTVHSMNAVAADNMTQRLRRAGYEARAVPFHLLLAELRQVT